MEEGKASALTPATIEHFLSLALQLIFDDTLED